MNGENLAKLYKYLKEVIKYKENLLQIMADKKKMFFYSYLAHDRRSYDRMSKKMLMNEPK